MRDGVLRVLLIIELTTDLAKSFHEANLLMMLISEGNLFGGQICDAQVTRVLKEAILFKEAIKLKEIKPTLNTGLKASKELQLF